MQIILISIILFLIPFLHLEWVEIVLKTGEFDEASMTLFQLYIAPFWFVLVLVAGIELYRLTLNNKLHPNLPMYLMTIGGLMSSILGIAICPVGPALFSQQTLSLIGGGLLITTVSGLLIKLLINQAGLADKNQVD